MIQKHNMKSFTAKFLFAILVVIVPFTVVGLESSYDDVSAPGDVIKEKERQGLRATMAASSSQTIVELAVGADPEFETLVAALTAAGLVDALSGAGPFTVFGQLVFANQFAFTHNSSLTHHMHFAHIRLPNLAPSEASFAALPDGTLEFLLDSENLETLKDILKYHVVSGKYAKCDFKRGVTTLETLNGETIDVKKTRFGKIFVNGIRASLPEIKASNGIIYKINGVLSPP
jgi:uncharacterized surface protein with fasciclin (FAS1) repeats